MKIVICDDDIYMLNMLEKYCKQLPFEDLRCLTYQSSTELLSQIEENTIEPDVYLLDIEMPEVSGIDIKDALVAKGNTSPIIFFTNHDEMMQHAFGRNVVAFISKGDWRECLGQQLAKIQKEMNDYLVVEHTEGVATIRLNDIVSINAENYYSKVIYKGYNKGILVRKTLKAWELELQQQCMYRVSRYVIINMENIKLLDGNGINMIDGNTYYLPKGKVRKFYIAFSKYRSERRYGRMY